MHGLEHTEIHVFDTIYIFSPEVVAIFNGLYTRSAGQLRSFQ
jgi:hypothetical protein